MQVINQQSNQVETGVAHHQDKQGRPLGFARPSEILVYLKISRSTLYRWIDAGQFVRPLVSRKGYTAWRWADIYAWEDALAASAQVVSA